MPDIILEQLEKVVAHNSDELHDKQTAIETYKLIKKKLTPMKATVLKIWLADCVLDCPCCGHAILSDSETQYCPYCGQAIDWGDNDET